MVGGLKALAFIILGRMRKGADRSYFKSLNIKLWWLSFVVGIATNVTTNPSAACGSSTCQGIVARKLRRRETRKQKMIQLCRVCRDPNLFAA